MGELIITVFWLVAAILGGALGLAVYALPTIIAIVRKRSDIALIAAVNLVGFWLFTIGWWAALVMALLPENRRGGDVTVIQQTTTPAVPMAVPPAMTPHTPHASLTPAPPGYVPSRWPLPPTASHPTPSHMVGPRPGPVGRQAQDPADDGVTGDAADSNTSPDTSVPDGTAGDSRAGDDMAQLRPVDGPPAERHHPPGGPTWPKH